MTSFHIYKCSVIDTCLTKHVFLGREWFEDPSFFSMKAITGKSWGIESVRSIDVSIW